MGRPEQFQEETSFSQAPPSYKEVMNQPFNQPPPQAQYSSSSATPRTVPRQFPPAFNLYRHSTWGSTTYTLGEHENQPLYMFASHSGFSSSPAVMLHSGPNTTYPVLASAELRSFSGSFDVDLPPVPGSATAAAAAAREEVKVDHHAFQTSSYRFSIEVEPLNQRETFEWRHSRSAAVQELDGQWSGWKLVRLAPGPPPNASTHVDSDGHEVVAAWAMASSSMTKVAKFHFTGTGASGQLGERWAIMAVVTALTLYQRVRRQRGAAAASAGAA